MIQGILRFVRFSHTVFALPFALGAMLVAAHGLPTLKLVALIVLCMVFARTAAMVFNRLADWEIDQKNPRTAERHTLVSRPTAITLLLTCCAGFVATTWFINGLCFALSPVALAIVFFYSLTKRFTSFSHLFLGFALAVSPVGAWFAVRGGQLVSDPRLLLGGFDLAPFVLAAAVLLWVAGFDIIYATQDYEFDRAEGLNSLVVRLGVTKSLVVAQWCHWGMFVFLLAFGAMSGMHWPFYGALALVLGALIYEHRSAARLDVIGINRAFFSTNAFVGAVFLIGIIGSLLVA